MTHQILKSKNTYQNEQQSNNNQNTTHPNHTEKRITQEEEMNIEILKKILPEKRQDYYH